MARFSRGVLALVACSAVAACGEDTTEPGAPIIGLSTQAVVLVGVEGGAAPVSTTISVSNDGTGSLTALEVTVTYEAGQPSGWLSASLDTTAAPATITLTATTGALAMAQYMASVAVTSAGVSNSPQNTDVVFIVSDPTQTWSSLRVRSEGTCGLMPVGAAFCWGASDAGQIGEGLTSTRLVPTPVSGGLTFAALTVGQKHTCAATPTGAVYCWGANESGQLGDGSTASRRLPVAAVGPGLFTSVTAGDGHTCAVTAAGDASCWGRNASGQLGDGTTGNRLFPTAVTGGVTFAMLTAGTAHTCGLTATGEAYCWGENEYGQLGDGTTGRRLTPTAVAGGRVFGELAAGSAHTCGRTAAGEVFCWGHNDAGQLGDGTVANRLLPTAVSGGLTFTHLAADVGGTHSCALDAAGAAYCWGDNARGQLGDGTHANRLTPTAVVGGLTFAELSAGGLHTCGIITAAGVGYCWGANDQGQLGDNTRTDRLVPVEVMHP